MRDITPQRSQATRVAASVGVCVMVAVVLACGGGPPASPVTHSPGATEMPLKTFAETKPAGPHQITAECQISKSDDNWLSADLRQRKPSKSVQAFTPRNGPLARDLYSILQDGNRHVLTLKVQYDAEGRLDILEIVSRES
jgi:hypothetical protein